MTLPTRFTHGPAQQVDAVRDRQPAAISRKMNREIVRRQETFTLELLNNEGQALLQSDRLERAGVLTGELNFFLEALGQQQDRLQHTSPTSAARIGHTLDQLAINGSEVIGQYLKRGFGA